MGTLQSISAITSRSIRPPEPGASPGATVMEPADALLTAGDLEGARRTLGETLRSDPRNSSARMLLFQIFCVTGEWDKASAQLRSIAQLDPESQLLEAAYNQVIAAERTRAAAFAASAPMQMLIDSPEWLSTLAQSLEAFARSEATRGSELRDRAFENAPDSSGTLNEKPFTRLADEDARFGPAFEAIIAGRWGFLPFESVSEIRSEGPKDVCDILWLPVEITLRSGPALAGFLPSRYPGTELHTENDLRLCRRTEWHEGVSGLEGVGQRQWFTDDGADFDILSLRRLLFS